jgi:hypothetical protein
MKTFTWLTRFSIISLLYFSSVFLVQAQIHQVQQVLKPFSGSGKIEAIGPDKIRMYRMETKVVYDDTKVVIDVLKGPLRKGESYQVKDIRTIFLQPTTKVTISGQAKPEFLHPGLFVKFKTELDQPRQITKPVDELTVMSQLGNKRADIFLDDAGTKVSRTSKKITSGPCTIIGRISTVNNNKLQIQAGREKISCEVAENAILNLELSDLSMARKEDNISVTGVEIPDSYGFEILATDVKVVLAQTLTNSSIKSAPGKSKSQRQPKQTKAKD